MYNLYDLINGLKKESSFYADKNCEYPFSLDNNFENINNKILVITGDNSSGKSLLLKVLKNYSKKTFNIKSIIVSLQERLNPLESNGNENRRIICLKNELKLSTGVSSVESVNKSFDIMSKWTQDSDTLIILEEPEVGLAQGYEYALGQFIAEKTLAEKDNKKFTGIVIVTHSKNVIKGIAEKNINPLFINMGKEYISMQEWLNKEDKKTVAELLNLLTKTSKDDFELEGLCKKFKKAS